MELENRSIKGHHVKDTFATLSTKPLENRM